MENIVICMIYKGVYINNQRMGIIVKEIKGYLFNLKRMFHYLYILVPQLFIQVICLAILDAILPYVNIIGMQLIIDGFNDKKEVDVLLKTVFAIILANMIIRAIWGEVKRRREVSENYLILKFQNMLSFHEMKLSIENIESTKLKEIKRNIEQAKMRNGGIENVIFDFEMVIRNIVSLIVSIIIFFRIFIGQTNVDNTSFFTSPYPVMILVGFVVLSTLITFKLQAAQNIRVSKLNEEANQANGSAFAYMEFISNYHFGKEIRIFELGDYLCNFFDNLWTSSIGYKLTQKLGKEKAKIPCITTICNEILKIFIYILAIAKACAKEISVGNFVVYVSSIQTLTQSMVTLIGASGEIAGHGALMKPYLELIDIEEETDTDNEESLDNINEIVFKNVYFKYPNQDQYVLEDVSFSLKRNQRIALVGENGAGKSTIIKLICRFYEPDQGEILVNGIDIHKYNKALYWKKISTVFQDFSLPALELGNVISGKTEYDSDKEKSILNNLGMGLWMSKVNNSLNQCIYNDFSDKGVEVSGGESQKIALARAVYKNASFIILDEPTSALDPRSEAEIYDEFQKFCKNRTCIFISHRLYSCKKCDDILVLHKGKIIQYGTHSELINHEGKYKELWDSQLCLYSEEV